MDLVEYVDALRQGQFATQRGLVPTRDDLVRGAVITALMCQGRVDIAAMERAHLVDFTQHFKTELEELQAHAADGLVTITPTTLEVTPLGWFAVRALAKVFDRSLQTDRRRERFTHVL